MFSRLRRLPRALLHSFRLIGAFYVAKIDVASYCYRLNCSVDRNDLRSLLEMKEARARAASTIQALLDPAALHAAVLPDVSAPNIVVRHSGHPDRHLVMQGPDGRYFPDVDAITLAFANVHFPRFAA